MIRKLTDEVLADIKIDRETHGMSLSQICEKYNLGKSCAFSAIKGMDDSQVVRKAPARRSMKKLSKEDRQLNRPNISKTDLGEAARQAIIAQLMLKGFVVFQPISEDTPIDLIILLPDNRVLKCQCKCLFLTKHGAHHMGLTHTKYKEKLYRCKYTKDDVDFFFGYALEDASIYVFPYESVSTLSGIDIWINRQPVFPKERIVDPSKFRNAYELLST